MFFLPEKIIDTHIHDFQGDVVPYISFIPATNFNDYLNNLQNFKAIEKQFDSVIFSGNKSNLIDRTLSIDNSLSLNLSYEIKKEVARFNFGIGVHPQFSNLIADIESIRKELLLNHKKIPFIGEIGLDKRYLHELSSDVQIYMCNQMLALAKEFDKPVFIHCVRMHGQMLEILNNFYQKQQINKNLASNGIIHGFTGSVEIAQEYIKYGFKLGIGSELLNIANKKLRNLITKIDLSNIVLETDYPYFFVNVDDLYNLFEQLQIDKDIVDDLLNDKLLQFNRNLQANDSLKVKFSGGFLKVLVHVISVLRNESEDDVKNIIFNNSLKFL
jgi:TatD DNase family protein